MENRSCILLEFTYTPDMVCRLAGGFLLFWSVTFAVVASDVRDLVYLTEDYPPDNYVEQGVLKGFAVDLLKAVWKKLGVAEQPIQVLPWARAYNLLQQGPNRVLFATARTPERESLFQWAGPIYQAQMALISLRGRLEPITTLEGARSWTIGVINRDIGETILLEAGFEAKNLTPVSTLAQLLRILEAGRVDAICTGTRSIEEAVLAEPSLARAFVTAFPVQEVSIYYAFSRQTDPKLVSQFQKALTAIDPERRAILKAYGIAAP